MNRIEIFAVKQHQLRREKRFNIAWLVNLIFKYGYIDYCMEMWISNELNKKKG